MFAALKPFVLAFQNFFLLSGAAFRGVLRRPHYIEDVDDHGMLLAVATCASTARWSFLRALTCRRERRNFTRKCPGGEL